MRIVRKKIAKDARCQHCKLRIADPLWTYEFYHHGRNRAADKERLQAWLIRAGTPKRKPYYVQVCEGLAG